MIKKHKKIVFLNIIVSSYLLTGATLNTPLPSHIFNEKKYLDLLFAHNSATTTFIPCSISNTTKMPMALQSDGCIIVATPSAKPGRFTLIRYLATGQIDKSFGQKSDLPTQVACINFPLANKNAADTITALTIQNDGKIVMVGQSQSDATCSLVLARFTTNGTLDTTFGKVGTPQAGTQSIDFSIGGANIDKATCIAIQGDGKIIVGGISTTGTSATRFFLARFNSNGTLDTNFGRVKTPQAGTQCLNFSLAGGKNDTATAVAVQQDGKIILSGHSATQSSFFHAGETRFSLARFTKDGTLDTTFGRIKTPQAGTQCLTFCIMPGATNDTSTTLTIQQDGKIIMGGSSGNPGSLVRFATAHFALARFNQDGTLDTTFGKTETAQAGTQFIDFTSQTNSFDIPSTLALQADGKILMGGLTCPAYSYLYPSHFAIARFNQDGTLDTTFNEIGTQLIGLPLTSGKFNLADTIVLRSKGGILTN